MMGECWARFGEVRVLGERYTITEADPGQFMRKIAAVSHRRHTITLRFGLDFYEQTAAIAAAVAWVRRDLAAAGYPQRQLNPPAQATA
jgi:hypothetical protein